MRLSLSMLFASVVLLSTTGLPHVKHLCNGVVQSVGIWGNANGCKHEKSAASTSCKSTMACHEHSKVETKRTACCKKPQANEVAQKKDCCTDQVQWEPSQLDLALGDQLLLDGQLASITVRPEPSETVIPHGEELIPNVRPPPIVVLPQSRCRALHQVYRC